MKTTLFRSVSQKSTMLVPFLAMIVSTMTATAKSKPYVVGFSEHIPAYKRTLLPSGRHEPESYAFYEGVCMDKSGKDASLNKLTFRELGAILAEALLESDYVPTPEFDQTRLLIVVHWGNTMPFDGGMQEIAVDSMAEAMNGLNQLNGASNSMASYYEGQIEQMFMLHEMMEDQRNRGHAYNAHLLGYQKELKRSAELMGTYFPMRDHYEELMDELESRRYFVILQAYDFQKLFKEKKKEMLWTTRFSIRSKGRRFDEEIHNMAMAAGRIMGGNTNSLRRGLQPARVEFGELEYLGIEKE